MLKLIGIIAPFIMGRFFGPQHQQGPNLIEKSVMAYRKILALTLVGLISAFVLSAGLILGAISIGQQLDLSGNWQWTNLALAGVWLVGLGFVGFVMTFAIGKFWDPNRSQKRTLAGLSTTRRALSGKSGHVSLPEVMGLFLLDILEERQVKRASSIAREEYGQPESFYSKNGMGERNQTQTSIH